MPGLILSSRDCGDVGTIKNAQLYFSPKPKGIKRGEGGESPPDILDVSSDILEQIGTQQLHQSQMGKSLLSKPFWGLGRSKVNISDKDKHSRCDVNEKGGAGEMNSDVSLCGKCTDEIRGLSKTTSACILCILGL